MGMITEIQRFQNDYTIHFRGFFDGALSLYLARSHTNFRSHLRTSFPAVLLLSVRLMAGYIKETFILLLQWPAPASSSSWFPDFSSFSRNPLRHRQPSD